MDDLDDLLRELTQDVEKETLSTALSHSLEETADNGIFSQEKKNVKNNEIGVDTLETHTKGTKDGKKDPISDKLNDLLGTLNFQPHGERKDIISDLNNLIEDLNGGTDETSKSIVEVEGEDLDSLMRTLSFMEENFKSKEVEDNVDTLFNKGDDRKLEFDSYEKNNLNDIFSSLAIDKPIEDLDASKNKSSDICCTCLQEIDPNNVVYALGKKYHQEHFICSSCGKQLDNKKFYELLNKQVCEACFQEEICFRCNKCNKLITDNCLEAMDEKWHKSCFVCTDCEKVLEGEFFVYSDKPYCADCYEKNFSVSCKACGGRIVGDFVNAMDCYWHPEHFNCAVCHKSFKSAYYQHEGMPYCEFHYFETLGLICPSCGSPILKTFVEALGHKWHPEHFNCTYCGISLIGNVYNDHGGKLYCKSCYTQLYA